MISMDEAWRPIEALKSTLEPLLPGVSVEVVPHIDSTNTELMRRVRAGLSHPVLLVAQRQTAGRGRLGRDWVSHAQPDMPPANEPVAEQQLHTSLTFSLGLPLNPPDWSGMSLAVGVSLAQSLHADLRLKWPNDVLLHGAKLAGILIETASLPALGKARFAVVGVGINLQKPPAQGLRTPPAGLHALWPGVSAPQVLQRVALPLVQALQRFEAQGFAPFQADFNALDALKGAPIAVVDSLGKPSPELQGVAQGVDATGALQVQTPNGLQRVTSSEVSVRMPGSK